MALKSSPPLIAARLLRIAVYVVAILSAPVLNAVLAHGSYSGRRLIPQLASHVGLVGYAILALQFVLAARLKWIERPFGLDRLFAFHKAMAVLAAALLLAHPLLMAWARHRWSLFYRLDAPWPIHFGRLALLLLLATIVVSGFRRAIRLEYQRWRAWHNVLVVSVLVLGFVHSAAMADLRTGPLRVLWLTLFGLALAAYGYHRWFSPFRARMRPFELVTIRRESPDVWTLGFRPVGTERPCRHVPGQFHFITLYRDGHPAEEHPFSISSSPAADGYLESTIKESGDFTATIGWTALGDRVAVRGPYGRFSHVLHPDEDDLVFIAGGVGITPFMSMLRFMRESGRWKSVLLIYANRAEDDILFRAELCAMSGSVKVVHVLSRAEPSWQGERGHVNRELILRHVGDGIQSKAFYVCGHPAMTDSMVSALRALGVPRHRVHTERFAL